MTAEKLAILAGVVLSLLFSYVPGFANWFEPLDGNKKRLIMLALLLTTAGGAFGLSCAGLLNWLTCDQMGAWALVQVFIAAAIANQATFALSPKPVAMEAFGSARVGAINTKKSATPLIEIVRAVIHAEVMRYGDIPDQETAERAKMEILQHLRRVFGDILQRKDWNRVELMIDQEWTKVYG